MQLSIITINRNNASGLRKTIESVIAQTWRDFEYIIIDGASTDDSVNVIRSYESINKTSQNPIQMKWVSESDSGIYNAMNKGTLKAIGDYCYYLNSGDCLFASNTLQNVFESKPTAQFIWGQVLLNGENGEKYLAGRAEEDFTEFQLLQSAPPHQGSFIRRNLLIKVGLYDEKYTLVADLKCIYQCLMFEKATKSYIGDVICAMEAEGVSYKQRERCLAEDDDMIREFYSETFLQDYHDWLRLQDEVQELKKEINKYKSAIVIYEKAHQNIITRKFYTLIYRIISKC